MATASKLSYGKTGLILFFLAVITILVYFFLEGRGPAPNTEMQDYQQQLRQH